MVMFTMLRHFLHCTEKKFPIKNIFSKYAKKTAGNCGFGHTVGGNR